jgi:hypothetical protein
VVLGPTAVQSRRIVVSQGRLTGLVAGSRHHPIALADSFLEERVQALDS